MLGKILLRALVISLLSSFEFEAHAAWTTDAKNRAVVNGQPVFLRIAYDQWFDGTVPAGHIATRNFADYGFNVYLHFMMGANENAITQLPALPPFMFGVATGNAFQGNTVEQMGAESGTQRFDLVLNNNDFRGRFNAEPKAGAVYLADEPQITVLDNIKLWSTTYKIDLPSLPRFVALMPEGPLIPAAGEHADTGWQEWVNGHANPYWWSRNGAGGDWFGEDPYPILFAETTRLAPWGYAHFWVADRAAHVVAAAKQHGLVPVIVLQLFQGTSDARFINTDELWSHMIMAVTEGVRGIAWWQIGRGAGLRAQPDAIRIPADDALKAITLLLRDLEPVILSDPNPALLAGNSTNTSDPVAWRTGVLGTVAGAIANYNHGAGGRGSYVAEKNALLAGVTQWSPMLDRAADVRTRAWETPDGTGYVFAYNYHPLERNAVALAWHKNLLRVEVLGEGRTITPTGASWTDDFGGSTSLNMRGKRIGHIYKLVPAGGSVPTASFTSPAAGATVSDLVTVGMAVSGAAAGNNTFRLLVDGSVVGSPQTVADTTATFSWDSRTVANGVHTLTAEVTDAANAVARGDRSITVDNPASGMTASFSSPAPGATVNGTTTIGMAVTGSATPTNNIFNLKLDGTQVFNHWTPATTDAFSWSTINTANGVHTLLLTVTDGNLNVASRSQPVTVNNVITARITSPTNGAAVSGVQSIAMEVTGDTSTWGHTFNLKVDGAQVLNHYSPGTTDTFAWDTSAVAQGPHTLLLTVTDGVGKSATHQISVNVGQLDAAITAPANNAILSGSTTVNMSVNASTTPTSNIFNLKVDGTQIFNHWTPATTDAFNWSLVNTANGAHTLFLTVTDGNLNAFTHSIAVNVNNAIAAAIGSPADGATVSGIVTVAMSVSGQTSTWGQTFNLKLDGAQLLNQYVSGTTNSFSWNTAAATNGSHTLLLTVTDGVGKSVTDSIMVNVAN